MSSSPLLVDASRSALPGSAFGFGADSRLTLYLGKRLSLSIEEDFLVILGTQPFVPRYSATLLNESLRRKCRQACF